MGNFWLLGDGESVFFKALRGYPGFDRCSTPKLWAELSRFSGMKGGREERKGRRERRKEGREGVQVVR